MEYAYQARDHNGVLKTGTVEALNEDNAYETLSQHGLIVIRILPAFKLGLFSNIPFFDRVSGKDIVLFSRQLATLIDAKVPIIQALNILQNQVSSNKLRRTIGDITEKVESGDSLSSALSNHPKIFSSLYINLVRSGELSGTLDESLTFLADQLEKDYDLRSKIVGALTYPIFILVALVVVAFLMFTFVLPPLVMILRESAVALPITTKILIAATDFMENFWWLAAMIILGLVFAYRYWSSTVAGSYSLDYFKIKLPIFGRLFRNIYLSRFTRNLATLIAGGIPVVKALDSVADIVGNRVYHDIILDASNQVRAGRSIASSLQNREEFPSIVGQMVQVGETTGKLREILEKLASFYEKEVEALLKVLTTLIEPLIMIILGIAVAIMVAGILLPIYNLASAV